MRILMALMCALWLSLPCQARPSEARAAAERLVAAYPQAGMRLVEEGGALFVELDGRKLLFSPPGGCPDVPSGGLLADPRDPPLCAMLAQPYPVGEGARHPAEGFNPGRVRSDGFFTLLYGKDAGSVAGHCRTVGFAGEALQFNGRHGAAEALGRVAADVERLLARDPALAQWVHPLAGSFFWRRIKNSPRLSMHSFGIAIDLNPDKGVYWLWKPPAQALERVRVAYPQALVDAFEAEGFIWGGKWDAFDFMHYEYRPELFPPKADVSSGENAPRD